MSIHDDQDNQDVSLMAYDQYMRLVMWMAQRCHRHYQRMELLDLIQEGTIGLLKAIERHQSERDREFIGFASISIRQALWQAANEVAAFERCLPENIGRV